MDFICHIHIGEFAADKWFAKVGSRKDE